MHLDVRSSCFALYKTKHDLESKKRKCLIVSEFSIVLISTKAAANGMRVLLRGKERRKLEDELKDVKVFILIGEDEKAKKKRKKILPT